MLLTQQNVVEHETGGREPVPTSYFCTTKMSWKTRQETRIRCRNHVFGLPKMSWDTRQAAKNATEIMFVNCHKWYRTRVQLHACTETAYEPRTSRVRTPYERCTSAVDPPTRLRQLRKMKHSDHRNTVFSHRN